MDTTSQLDEDDVEIDNVALLEKFLSWKTNKKQCCAKACFEHFQQSVEKNVWKMCDAMVRFGSTGAATAEGKAMRKMFISTVYVLSLHKITTGKTKTSNKRVREFTIPYYPRLVCREFFRSFFSLGDRAMNVITNRVKSTVVPPVHGLQGRTGKESNRFNESNYEYVVAFVKDMARRHGMPWPVRVHMSKILTDDKQLDDDDDDFSTTEYIMPAGFTKRELHRMYTSKFPNDSVCWASFLKILKSDELENIRINKSEKGVCGLCLSLCLGFRV
mgnify:CR=1 FL=1